MIDSLTPRLLRAYDGYAEVDVPVLQSNSSSFTHMDHGKESFVGLQSFVDLIYLRDSATNELVAGAALSDQDNSTRWQFEYSKSVRFVDVYAHHHEYGLWVQENPVYHSPHKLGKAKGGKAYRAGQALHDPPGRPVPWSVEGGDGAQVAYNYLGQGSWGQGEVYVRQGDQWVRQGDPPQPLR